MDLDLNHSSGLKNNWHSEELKEKDFEHICILSSLVIVDCIAAGGIFSFCSCLNSIGLIFSGIFGGVVMDDE